MVSPLSRMMFQAVTIEYFAGRSAYGDTYSPPVSTAARIEGGNKLIRDAQGNTVVPSHILYAPVTVADAPLSSRVTLPEPYAPQSVKVIGKEINESPNPGAPRHVVLFLG